MVTDNYDKFTDLKTTIHNSEFKECMYIEGNVVDILTTPSLNKLVVVENSRYIKFGDWLSARKTPSSEMRLLVPRRRNNVMGKLQYLDPKKRYVFKLVKETHSKKFCMAEIFKQVTTDFDVVHDSIKCVVCGKRIFINQNTCMSCGYDPCDEKGMVKN